MSCTRSVETSLAAMVAVGVALMAAEWAVASPYSDAVLAGNPVAYYRLGEAAGTNAANSSAAGASLDGSYVNFGVAQTDPNTPSTMGALGPRPGDTSGGTVIDGLEADNLAIKSGANGTALPAAPAQVEVPDNALLDITGALTLEAWVYRDPQAVNGNNEGIVAKYQGSTFGNERSYCLYYNPRTTGATALRVGFVLSDSGSFNTAYDLTTPGDIPLGEWVHLAATYDPATPRMAIFVNGELAVERTDAGGIPASVFDSAAPLWIGRQFSTAANVSFEGGIDEVAVYGAALADATILAHYQAATAPISMPDLNMDGFVDIFDVNLVSANWGTASAMGDANKDGTVDIFDVNLISANWSPPPAPGGGAAVPEPASLLLATFALSCLLVARRFGVASTGGSGGCGQ